MFDSVVIYVAIRKLLEDLVYLFIHATLTPIVTDRTYR
jgi:hypothetical protein